MAYDQFTTPTRIKNIESGCGLLLSRKPGSGRPCKIMAEMKDIVETKMREDDETTAYQLHSLLVTSRFTISRRTVLRCHESLGWTFQGSAYYQMQ